RGHGRCQGHDAGQQGEDFGGFPGGIDVADDGATQYRASGAAQGLQKPEQLQGFDVVGQGAADARNSKEQEATDHDGFAAEAVGQRPTDELCDGEAGQVDAQGQLDLVGAGMEVGADLGQRWQIHVHGQWPEGDGGGQQYGCPDACEC